MTPNEVAAAAQLACLLEVSAPKPGNVSPGRHFPDARYDEFLASAAAIGGPMAAAGGRPVGTTVRQAIEATRRWTRSNTNLGLVLLLAPIARAASEKGVGSLVPGSGANKTPDPFFGLRRAVRRVLAETTMDDAREVYAAIRLAAPGGLGKVEAGDVAEEPTTTLIDAMRMAADRDGIAREYVTAFETTFDIGTPALQRARGDGLSWDDAVVETFLTLLAARPDTHIARRAGAATAAKVSDQATMVLGAGGVRSDEGRRAITEMDGRLRGDGHLMNPGTTADLTAAAIFVALLNEGG